MSHVVKLFPEHRRCCPPQCLVGAFACHVEYQHPLSQPLSLVLAQIAGILSLSWFTRFSFLFSKQLLISAHLWSLPQLIRGPGTQLPQFSFHSTPTKCSHPLVVCTCEDSLKFCICLIPVLIVFCLYHYWLSQESPRFKFLSIIFTHTVLWSDGCLLRVW